MFKQFNEMKKKHPDALLLFRCGDFYETYDTDASIAATILGITLTKNTKIGINMAGFPYHALDTYLPKLIRAGKRVAICDQMEDPSKEKKLVKRGIVDVVTPGEKKSEEDSEQENPVQDNNQQKQKKEEMEQKNPSDVTIVVLNASYRGKSSKFYYRDIYDAEAKHDEMLEAMFNDSVLIPKKKFELDGYANVIKFRYENSSGDILEGSSETITLQKELVELIKNME